VQPSELIQVAGLVAILGLAIVLAFDGIQPGIVVLLIMAVLGISAPRAFEELLSRGGND